MTVSYKKYIKCIQTCGVTGRQGEEWNLILGIMLTCRLISLTCLGVWNTFLTSNLEILMLTVPKAGALAVQLK